LHAFPIAGLRLRGDKRAVRVIGGEFRSRRLKTLSGLALRPTSDRLRETLFDILANEVRDKVFVDAYAGSGAVGIEALSRGAARAVFIENGRAAAAVLRENVRSFGLDSRSRILEMPANKALGSVEGEIVFLDPPYREGREYDANLTLLGGPGQEKRPLLVIAQHSSRTELLPAYGSLARYRVLRQGESSLSFYRREGAAEPPV